MQVNEALLSRRTVFKYQPRAIADVVLDRALECARWAPNHRLTEPWTFLVVGPKTKTRLADVAERLAHKKAAGAAPDALPGIIARQRAKVAELPGLVVVLVGRNPDDPFVEKEDYAAAVCALHNLVLSLWSDGVGAQWGTGGLTRDPETYTILDVDPARDEIIGFVKMGYPQVIPASTRQPLADVVRRLA